MWVYLFPTMMVVGRRRTRQLLAENDRGKLAHRKIPHSADYTSCRKRGQRACWSLAWVRKESWRIIRTCVAPLGPRRTPGHSADGTSRKEVSR